MPSALGAVLAAIAGAAAGDAGVADLAAVELIGTLLVAAAGCETTGGSNAPLGASGVLPEDERAGAGRSTSFLTALSS